MTRRVEKRPLINTAKVVEWARSTYAAVPSPVTLIVMGRTMAALTAANQNELERGLPPTIRVHTQAIRKDNEALTERLRDYQGILGAYVGETPTTLTQDDLRTRYTENVLKPILEGGGWSRPGGNAEHYARFPDVAEPLRIVNQINEAGAAFSSVSTLEAFFGTFAELASKLEEAFGEVVGDVGALAERLKHRALAAAGSVGQFLVEAGSSVGRTLAIVGGVLLGGYVLLQLASASTTKGAAR